MRIRFVIGLIAAFGALAHAGQQPPQADWASDVRFVRDRLLSHHPKLAHGKFRELFERATTDLAGRAPTLTRSQVIVELTKALALVQDGHTQVGLAWDAAIGFRRYPLDLYRFSDGIFVRGAAPEHRRFAGARVLAIDGIPVEEVIARLRPIIHGDNEMKLWDVLPSRMTMAEVLHVLQVTRRDDAATFLLSRSDGSSESVVLTPVPLAERIAWVRARDASKNALPLYQRNLDKPYEYTYLPDTRTMYVRYSAVTDDQRDPFADFCRRLFEEIARLQADRLVLDLRLNNGGDNTLYKPLLHGLIKSPVSRRGHLFVVIGRLTFSAAVNLAADLEQHTEAIFVGEPTAAPVNHYGETQRLVLPSSGISILYSSLFWQSGRPDDARQWIEPTILTPLSSADYADNRDPALDAINRYPR